MKKINWPKIFITTIFSLFAFLCFANFSSVSASSLILNPPFGNIEAGKDLSLDIVLKADGESVSRIDVVLNFDVNVLKVREVKEGTIFNNYPLKKDENGKLRLSALAPESGLPVSGEVIVATVVFEILDTGDTKVTLAFEENSTVDSNVILFTTPSDSLTEVKNGNYSVIATAENVKKAKKKDQTATGADPLPFFLLILVFLAAGVGYYLKHKKPPKEEVFIPEPFPLDQPPKA